MLFVKNSKFWIGLSSIPAGYAQFLLVITFCGCSRTQKHTWLTLNMSLPFLFQDARYRIELSRRFRYLLRTFTYPVSLVGFLVSASSWDSLFHVCTFIAFHLFFLNLRYAISCSSNSFACYFENRRQRSDGSA